MLIFNLLISHKTFGFSVFTVLTSNEHMDTGKIFLTHAEPPHYSCPPPSNVVLLNVKYSTFAVWKIHIFEGCFSDLSVCDVNTQTGRIL